MSCKTSQYRGFGFYVQDISTVLLGRFAYKYRDILGIPEEAFDMSQNDWLNEDFDPEDYADEGWAELICQVINAETMLELECFGNPDEYERKAVMLPEAFPWQYNYHERTLTRDELLNELEPFAKELGINRDEIDIVKIECFG